MCEIKKRWPPADTIPAVTINAIAMPEGTGRVPHVRLSVHGPKTMGAAVKCFYFIAEQNPR